MISQDTYYGRAAYRTNGTIYRVPQRVLDISGAPFTQLPTRVGLHPGGPYFLLLNKSGGNKTLKNELGATILTMPNNTVTTVLLGTTRWWAKSKSINGSKAWGTDGPSVRTVPVGYVLPDSTLVQPVAYNSFECQGGYRRARACGSGAKVNIWMLTTDLNSFVDGVVAFRYNCQPYYFKESDPLLVGHGFLLANADVSWYEDCLSVQQDSVCCWDNWPAKVKIHITDNVNPYGAVPAPTGINLTGVYEMDPRVGVLISEGGLLADYYIVMTCGRFSYPDAHVDEVGTWRIRFGNVYPPGPFGGTHYESEFYAPVTAYGGPPTGVPFVFVQGVNGVPTNKGWWSTASVMVTL